MKEYNYIEIKCIGKDSIIFSDGFTIFFKDCINSFGKHYNSFKNISTCIAERNIFAQPPYFLFYLDDTEVKIKFESKGLFKKKKNDKLFHSFQLKIINLGYKTFDLG